MAEISPSPSLSALVCLLCFYTLFRGPFVWLWPIFSFVSRHTASSSLDSFKEILPAPAASDWSANATMRSPSAPSAAVKVRSICRPGRTSLEIASGRSSQEFTHPHHLVSTQSVPCTHQSDLPAKNPIMMHIHLLVSYTNLTALFSRCGILRLYNTTR